MSLDIIYLPLIQLERRFRRVKAQIKKLFRTYWILERREHPLRQHAQLLILNRVNDLIKLMIADTNIHLNVHQEPRVIEN